MKDEKFLTILILAICFVLSACIKNEAESNNEMLKNSTSVDTYSKIEDVDFKNFSYSHGENDKHSFTLTDGEKPYGNLEDITFKLRIIQYADLTNDNENEAIINIFVGYGGSSTSSIVYIYTLDNKQPKRIWYFNSGYNANGGLKDIRAENNNLVIEFFGDTKFDKNANEFNFPNNVKFPQELCCPNKFIRFYFKWNDEKFILEDKPKLFDYDWRNQSNENLQRKQKQK